ncbi:EAL domain-containing protein [Celerinatantimonas sp. MCCC 1A17872]|uniref:bifunctional diguanylate cyclase/phosphodiesterase n=1 Tax=Celerinatantimonas sp. MCCC 1A17872 TaxID=3177514 RepID=UPI0038CB3754
MEDEYYRQQLFKLNEQLNKLAHTSPGNADKELIALSSQISQTAMQAVSRLSKQKNFLRKQQQLRSQRLDLILQGAAVTIWELDLKSKQVSLSGELKLPNSLQVETQNQQQLSMWLKRIHKQDRQRLKSEFIRYLRAEKAYLDIEFRMYDPLGGYRFVQCRGIGNRSALSKCPTSMAGTLNDLTDVHYLDADCGLMNLNYFSDVFDDEVHKNDQLSCIVINIANMHDLSTMLSTQSRAKLMQRIINRICKARRPHDLLCSIDKSQYVLLMRGLDSSHLATIAEKLAQLLNRSLYLDNQRLWITPQVGAIDVKAHQLASAEQVLGAARSIFLELQGKHQASALYQQRYRENKRLQLETEQWIRQAIAHDWLVPYLQPLVDFTSCTVRGYEVLTRIEHPQLGLIPPGQYIPVAEQTGLIVPLTEVLIEKAVKIAQSPELHQMHQHPFRLSINISAKQFHQRSLPRQLAMQLKNAKIDPQRIKVELTESDVMENIDAAVGIIESFQSHGIKVALDDFGTGYSSLAYLRQLPLDIIKLDRSIVSGVTDNERQSAIVEMILLLAQRIDMQVIVEGIETQQEYQYLRKLGANWGQGYLFSKPLPQDEIVHKIPAIEQQLKELNDMSK